MTQFENVDFPRKIQAKITIFKCYKKGSDTGTPGRMHVHRALDAYTPGHLIHIHPLPKKVKGRHISHHFTFLGQQMKNQMVI